MLGVRTRFGPPSPNAQRSLQPVGCTPTLAPDTWHHWWNVFHILQHEHGCMQPSGKGGGVEFLYKVTLRHAKLWITRFGRFNERGGGGGGGGGGGAVCLRPLKE